MINTNQRISNGKDMYTLSCLSLKIKLLYSIYIDVSICITKSFLICDKIIFVITGRFIDARY
jgi:hypothetical protein